MGRGNTNLNICGKAERCAYTCIKMISSSITGMVMLVSVMVITCLSTEILSVQTWEGK